MIAEAVQLSIAEIEAGLDGVRQSPKDAGVLELIVRRPESGVRDVLEAGELDLKVGLVGDNWIERPSTRSADGKAHPDMQLNVVSTRFIDLVAQERERWQLAGDQLFIDLDLSQENLPAGTRLAIGEAVIEVTDQPHTGCAKFAARFGNDAQKFVMTPVGRQMRLRGLCAKVVQPGTIRRGDAVVKMKG
ncbi:MAG: MOSC domain-containing protein [Chloroflexi bacterium]|nr:MAG: MOSC domain-containing protein [Chloroflexota bacterium]